MKQRINRIAALVAGALASSAGAAGFSLDTQGAAATGMGTAVTARIGDPSAIFYNPAGLTRTEGVTLMAGATLIAAHLTFTPTASDDSILTPGASVSNVYGIRGGLSTTSPTPPPYAFVSAKIGEHLAVGVGIFTNFGNVLLWPENWEGRTRSITIGLATYNLNPTVAYEFSKRVRVGLGVQLVRSTVDLVKKLNFVDTDATAAVSVAGGAFAHGLNLEGIGINAGVQVEVVPEVLDVGATFRSGVPFHYTGQAHFTDVPIEFAGLAHDQALSADLRMPNTATAGIAWSPSPVLTVAADVDYFRWRSIQAIAVTFEDPQLNQTTPKHWHDTFNYHLGVELKATRALTLRLGAIYDPTPSPSDTLAPDLPDGNRIVGSAGAGYAFSDKLQVDVAYMFVAILTGHGTTPGYEGNYSGSAHVIGASIVYRL